MSNLKLCQGTQCHTYRTKDRIRGTKGNKFYQTRRRSSFYYLGGNACSMACERDWFEKFGERAINHFGRIVEPIKLTEENAWYKDYDWRHSDDGNTNHYFVNNLNHQRIAITERQYDDVNITNPKQIRE